MLRQFVVRSTRGIDQEWRFTIDGPQEACRVSSIISMTDCLPQRGPTVLTPVPYGVARAWVDAQMAKLSRKAAKFQRFEPMLTLSSGRSVDPQAAFRNLLERATSGLLADTRVANATSTALSFVPATDVSKRTQANSVV